MLEHTYVPKAKSPAVQMQITLNTLPTYSIWFQQESRVCVCVILEYFKPVFRLIKKINKSQRGH